MFSVSSLWVTRCAISFFSIIVMATSILALHGNGRIAFTSERDGNREIYVMNSDGSNQTRLTESSFVDDHPAWSPDGRKIAFVSQKQNGGFAIFIMNADGSARTEVTSLELTGSNYSEYWTNVSWSPSGDKLAFHDLASSRNTDIFTVRVDGSDRQNLTSNHGDFDVYPVWSPDGSRILFSRYGLYFYGGTMLHTVKYDGTELTSLLNGFQHGWNEDYPDWSVTNNRILYCVNVWDFYTELYIANPDGAQRQPLGISGCGISRFSPDGTKIVYSSYGSTSIWVVNVGGSGLTVLTDRGTNPSWQSITTAVSVSGRVTTPWGSGLRGAVVLLTDSLGVHRTATTSTFGFYSFDNLTAGGTYTISVASRRFRFQPRTLTINDNLTDINFAGEE